MFGEFWSFASAFLGAIVYSSFFEWFAHARVMHTRRYSQEAFRRHVIDHHKTRRALERFYIPLEEDKTYKWGQTSVVPFLWLLHLPAFAAIWWKLGAAVSVGAAIGIALYIAGYEFVHYFVHAPNGYWFQRTRLFRFWCEYHRLHHYKPRINYNVVLPLADFLLHTMTLEDLSVEPNRPQSVPPDTGPKGVWRS
jgi:hypothetical protein